MRIIQTQLTDFGAVQIQDHGVAFLVVYPATEPEVRGWNREKTFDKKSWNAAQMFAASVAAYKEDEDRVENEKRERQNVTWRGQ